MIKPDLFHVLITLFFTFMVVRHEPFVGAFNTTLSILCILCSVVAVVNYWYRRRKYKAYLTQMKAIEYGLLYRK